MTDNLPEQVRNKLLRRADWRFLLRNPTPGKSVCFAGGVLAEAVELISAHLVGKQSAPAGDCDLAVAVDPDPDTLRHACAALGAGGSCYTEWHSPLIGGPKGIRRRLEAAGFETVTCYWRLPFSHPKFWLPLESPGALRFFLASRPKPRNLIRRIINAVLRAMWLFALRLALLPICAVAHKPAFTVGSEGNGGDLEMKSAAASSDIPTDAGVLDLVRAGWASWGLSSPPDRLSLLLLTGGFRSISKLVGLVFVEPDPAPRLAVKIPRVEEAVVTLTREAEALQGLRPDLEGVPRVLFCKRWAGGLVLGETAVTGIPLLFHLRRNNYRDLAMKATAWLADLAGRPEPSARSSWWDRLIEPVIAQFDESFGAVTDPAMLRETREIVNTLGPLPLVCEQRDFSPWNVLLTDDGSLAVVDWESSELRGLPALDLLYFLTYLTFFRDGAMESGRFRDSYRTTLDRSTMTGSIVDECVELYCSHTGLDRAALRPLRLFVWLLHSRSEYYHFMADVAGRPERRILERSVFVRLWEEEFRNPVAR